uniref:G-protein coupled receptors family 1 profile domain-containing protein n=1 Tax=Monopterus albus TaxID=43700 RepID=A0A3Q3QSQ4_MONAL
MTMMDRRTSDTDVLSSSSPSPPLLSHCDYTDWTPSFSIIPFIYLLAFLVGCFGNSLVLWVYLDRAEGRRARTEDKPQSGDGNLALADLCFLVTLPLWAVYTAMGYHWPFGQPLCQISSFLTALNMYASVFSLSMLSVERYWVLTGRRHSSHHALRSCRSRALCVLGGVWVLAGILALPGLLLRSSVDSGSVFLSCQMDYSMLTGTEQEETEKERAEMWWAAALSLKSTLIGFLLPLVVLLICYCSLAQLLSRHFGRGPRPDRRRQHRLLRVIVTLVMAFFLCWLPLHVNKTLSLLLEFGFVPYSCSLDQILLAAQPYVTCLAYLNSCLNPLLYAAYDPLSSFRPGPPRPGLWYTVHGSMVILSLSSSALTQPLSAHTHTALHGRSHEDAVPCQLPTRIFFRALSKLSST